MKNMPPLTGLARERAVPMHVREHHQAFLATNNAASFHASITG